MGEFTKIIINADPRLKRSIFEKSSKLIVSKEIKKKVRFKKSAGKYLFYSDACKRGFMNENTMGNHIKTEKHKSKIAEMWMEEKSLDEILRERRKFNNGKKLDGEFIDNGEDSVEVEKNLNEDNIDNEEDFVEVKKKI